MWKNWTVLIVGMLALGGCRGKISDAPPIHIVPNMDDQEKYDPQEAGPQFRDGRPIFADGRAARMPVPGTVARGQLKTDTIYFEGKYPNGYWAQHNPEPATMELLRRGQERFNIYCAACHNRLGSGQGLMQEKILLSGGVIPTNLLDERIRLMPDGQIFNSMTIGVRQMPSYRHQINPRDRWAIVAYMRALQRSQQTDIEDVPPDRIPTLKVKQ